MASILKSVYSHKWKTDQTKNCIENQDWASDSILVRNPRPSEHDDSSESVGRCDETLRCTDREPHLIVKDQWQKVCNRIGDRGQAAAIIGQQPFKSRHAAWFLSQGKLLRMDHPRRTYKNIMAKPQILRSRPEDAHFFKLNFSTAASSRSLLILRMIKAHSFSDRNFHAVRCARSGKSTRRKYPAVPSRHVIMPSMMKILRWSVRHWVLLGSAQLTIAILDSQPHHPFASSRTQECLHMLMLDSR